MLKKLDILIIRAFVMPFIATFFIAEFILTLQFFWLYLDDMVGKGLNIFILLKLIGLVMVIWVPMALPLAMLLSSIMTFGNLGETYETVAIKASGISLLRFMKPLIVVATCITLVAFTCYNYFIPVAMLKFETLKHDIIVKQPAFDIKEGVFYNKLKGYVIKIGKKEQNDSTIRDVIIFENNNTNLDNALVAKSGIMRVTKDQKFLEFVLYDGCRYEEKGQKHNLQNDYIRMGFKEYSKLLDLSSLQMNKTNESGVSKNAEMLSVRQIGMVIDSIKKGEDFVKKNFKERTKELFVFAKYNDSSWKFKDTFTYKKVATFHKLIPDSLKTTVFPATTSTLNIATANISSSIASINTSTENINSNKVEWHKRFTMSLACLVLFLVGAPLGSIIRKGGLGTPLVFAIGFFAIFHLLNTMGTKLAKSGATSPFVGLWLSTFVMVPIAAFLVYKALKDSQLFNSEFYFRIFRSIKKYVGNSKLMNKFETLFYKEDKAE